jgi:dTDP-4-dehydrorhamnose 3,5-epimerase-like enzyme
MKKDSFKLTTKQIELITQIFENIEELSKDESFITKMENAYNIMDDGGIIEENEEDYMKLINFKEEITDLISDSFPDSEH